MHFTAPCLPALPPLAAAAGCRGRYVKDWEKRCRWGLLEIFGKMSVEQASPVVPCVGVGAAACWT